MKYILLQVLLLTLIPATGLPQRTQEDHPVKNFDWDEIYQTYRPVINDIIAFDHVNLIPMTSDTVLPDRTVIVQGDRIREILEPGKGKIPEDAMIIDGSGKYLMPGLDTVSYKKWDDLMLATAFKLLGPVYLENSQAAFDQIKERLSSEIVKLKGQDVTVTTTLVADEAIYLSYNDTLSIQAKPGNIYQVQTFWKDLRAGKSKNSYFIGREKAARVFYDMVTYSVKEIRKNNIPVVAGTDAGPYFMGIVPGFSMHDELQLMVEAGYSPFEAISAATCDASKVIEKMTGINDFGTIETGKRADLVLLGNNPFENVNNTREIAGVMTAGIWLPEDKLAELLAVKRKFVTPVLREVWKQTGSVDSVIAVYKRLSQDNYLNTYYMGEYVLTNIGYDLLKNNLVDEAIRIFRLNIEEYPTAANPYDCLAEAYLKKGERNLAIDSYKKALRWDPGFNSAIKALKELEN